MTAAQAPLVEQAAYDQFTFQQAQLPQR